MNIKYKWEVLGQVAVSPRSAELMPYFLYLAFFPNFQAVLRWGLSNPLTCLTPSFRGKPGAAGSPRSASDVPFIHAQASKGRSKAGELTHARTAEQPAGAEAALCPGFGRGRVCAASPKLNGEPSPRGPLCKSNSNQNSVFTFYQLQSSEK